MPSPRPKSRTTSNTPAEAKCHGRNADGAPCQRRIKASAAASSDDDSDESLYCHDHKLQAKTNGQRPAKTTTPKKPVGRPPKQPMTDGKPPKPYRITVTQSNVSQDSLYSLTARVGLMSIQDPAPAPPPRPTAPSGPPGDPYLHGGLAEAGIYRKKKKKKHSIFCCFSFLCLGNDEDDEDEYNNNWSEPPRPQQHFSPTPGTIPRPPEKIRQPPAALIPQDLPTQCIQDLEKEIAKGFTHSDRPGYIYIFWHTRNDNDRSALNAARSALESPARTNGPALTGYHSTDTTLYLKIGKAVDVRKRMREWFAQCKIPLELLRFYPYVQGSSADNIAEPHPTPHYDRVEALIQMELRGWGMGAEREECLGCGRTHQEWFSMPYTVDSVRKVDGIIRKWVEWDRKTTAEMNSNL